MILTIGGAFQGKTAFAKSMLSLKEEEIFDGTEWPKAGDASAGWFDDYRAVCHYEEVIRAQVADGQDPVEELHRILGMAPFCLIADEVGRGIVPLERAERAMRDAIGRTLIEAAKAADAVYRVTCGIGERIK